VNEITIGQIGPAFAFRVLAYGKEFIQASSQILNLNQRRSEGGSIHDKWIGLTEIEKDSSAEANHQFNDSFTNAIGKFDAEILQFANIHLTRSFISLLFCLRGRPRIPTLDFADLYSEISGETEFSADLDDGIIGE
ncbi:hypothetical protein PENTCL1PPCAC_7404, partial [Pristionchus entomophagus]